MLASSADRWAGDTSFDYSPSLRAAREQGLAWNAALLLRFLRDPEAMFPGLWMSSIRLYDDHDIQALVIFLSKPGR